MENKIVIDINGKSLNLPSDFSIDIEDVNPYFNDNESFSYEVPVSIEDNRAIFKDVDDVQSDKRMVDFENSTMRLKVNGVPFRSGKLQISEDAEVSDEINISMISTSATLKDLISDKNCQDIPVKDKIQIGEMIGDINIKGTYKYNFVIWAVQGSFVGPLQTDYITDNIDYTLNINALGYSFPGICKTYDDPSVGMELAERKDGKPVVEQSFINVSNEYPFAQYCNARVCYTHYKAPSSEDSTPIVSTSGEFDPYFVLDADRSQSGICFYVLYFLECLFHALNLSYNSYDLLQIGDLKRLCFFTTHCKYDLERKYPDSQYPDLWDINKINNWLNSRITKGNLSFRKNAVKDVDNIELNGQTYKVGDYVNDHTLIKSISVVTLTEQINVTANIMNMYANSKNFPDESVSSVIDSLWASFGIRFLVDYDKQTVDAVLIRDLFRDTSAPIVLKCDVIDTPVKLNEKITGVRMRYSAESDNAEKTYNINYGVKDYDTNYDYIDYRNINTSLDYLSIIKQQGSSDTTCYIDLKTGNKYRLKVDKDAENYDELRPNIFEVGGFTGVEIGNCNPENEDYIEELISDFQPIIPNDVNGKRQRSSSEKVNVSVSFSGENVPEEWKNATVNGLNITDREQILAMFIDEEMQHENTEMIIKNAIGTNYADMFLEQKFWTDESYDVTQTENGESPLQTIDWGLSIGVMRGGGSDARIETYDWNYDGHGNSKWRTVAGKYAMSSDSMDNWGSQYDYNGTESGIGEDERFSLKIRSYIEKDGQILCNDDIRDSEGNIETKIRTRGLYDTFMSEYAHFLLNRKKLQIKFRCEVAELANIQWGKRYNIGGYIGWINKLNYTISAEEGLGIVTAELYQL